MRGPSIAVYGTILASTALVGIYCSPVTLSRPIIKSFVRRHGAALGITRLAGYMATDLIVVVALRVNLMFLVSSGAGKSLRQIPQWTKAGFCKRSDSRRWYGDIFCSHGRRGLAFCADAHRHLPFSVACRRDE